MSFILDALRKSEHERQRQAGPVIAEMPIARPASRMPSALIAVGALLAVNLAVLLWFLLRDDSPEVVREEPVQVAAPATQAPPTPLRAAERPAPVTPAAAAAPAPIARAMRPLAGEATQEPSAAPMREAPGAPDPSLLPPAPLPVTTAVPRYPSAPASGQEFIPRLETLPPQATAGLPALNLDLHIYAPDPAQRAAFINGRRYREGDTTAEGIEVLAITTEGAVLRHRGQRFLLPRQ